MTKVFLGGTANGSDWRKDLIPKLEIDFYDPIVTGRDWTEEDRLKEIKEREDSDFCLYVITPRMKGLYSLAEIIDDSNKRPAKTIIVLKKTDNSDNNRTLSFLPELYDTINDVIKLAVRNGAKSFDTLTDVALYLNNFSESK